jgi:hypothetical protein
VFAPAVLAMLISATSIFSSGTTIDLLRHTYSPMSLRFFADVFDLTVVKFGVDQQAASLGPAALAFACAGLW